MEEVNVNGQWVKVNNINAPIGGDWNNLFRARYGSHNVEWMQATRFLFEVKVLKRIIS